MATGGSQDGDIKLFDIETGKELRSIDGGSGATWALRYSGDGKSVVASHANRAVRAYSTSEGTLLKNIDDLPGFNSSTYDLSKDGKYMATWLPGDGVVLIDMKSWTSSRIETEDEGAGLVSISPTSRHLVTAVGTKLRVYEIETRKEVIAFDDIPIGSRPAWLADGSGLVVAGSDGNILIFGKGK